MADRTKSILEETRKWSVWAFMGVLLFAGKATVKDAVREELAPLQVQVRALEMKVAALEAMQKTNNK